ncbi:hypothetical protein VTI74DRAFT_6379 [Chaetomium olivicolor]
MIAQQTTILLLKERLLDDFDIHSLDGARCMHVEAKLATMRGRKKVCDAAGRYLFDSIKEAMHWHTTFAVQDESKRQLMEIKSTFALVGSKTRATFTTSQGNPVVLMMKGDWLKTSADIIDESSGAVVARIDRKLFNAREAFLGTQTYYLTVAPGVDMALMAAMCIALDEKQHDNEQDCTILQLSQLDPVPTVTKHSNKIHEFFGIPPSTNSHSHGSQNTLNDNNTGDQPSELRASSSTYKTITNLSAKIKNQYRQHHPAIRHQTRRTVRSLSFVIQSCTPIWLTPSKSLALLALSLRLLPLVRVSFPALIPLSTAFYLAALALFLPASALFVLRLLCYPRETYRAVVHERDTSGLELGYLASWPTAFTLLVSFAAFAAAEGKVGTERAPDVLSIAVYVCWWASAAWAVATVLFVMACLLSTSAKSSSRTSGGRFAPLVGFLVAMTGVQTVALVGGLMCWLRKSWTVGEDGVGGGDGILSRGMATPVVVFSFCAAGAALFLAFFDYSVLLHELMLVIGWPPAEHTAVVLTLVGPLGQCASALLALANAAGKGITGMSDGEGIVVGSEMLPRMPIDLICVVMALMIGGVAVMWLLVGIMTVFYRLFRGELVWNPSWNEMTSPVSTLGILSILLGMELHSSFFRIAACVVIVGSVLLAAVNLVFTIRLATTAKTKRDVTATGNMGVV